MTQADKWLRRYHPAEGAASRLVCFPHAGGSASFYLPMSRALAPEVDVVATQYPGRQDRRGEPGLTSVDELADRLAEVLTPLADRPVVLFGHSMGALVAYEVARRLEAAGAEVRALVASGRRAPSLHRDENVRGYSDDRLLAELRMLSGTDLGLLQDDEVVRMILPALRADYHAVETYRHRQGAGLDAPILALIGDSDPRVDLDEVDAWAGHTRSEFERRVFRGGHFYLTRHQEAVIAAIRDLVAVVPSH